MQLLYQYCAIGIALVILLVVIVVLSGPVVLFLSRPAPSAQKYALQCIHQRKADVVIKEKWLDSDKWRREVFITTLRASSEVLAVQEEEVWEAKNDEKRDPGESIGTRYLIAYRPSWFNAL